MMERADADVQLRQWLNAGDDRAWAAIAREVAPWVHARARHLLRCDDDAADVTQQVLVTLWRSHASIRESVVGWLATTTRNAALDLLKSPRHRHTGTHGDEWDTVQVSVSHEAGAVAEVTRQQLMAHLRRVSPDLRETFVLRAVHGFSYPQIARLQSITVGAAKMRVLRARMAIRAFTPVDGES